MRITKTLLLLSLMFFVSAHAFGAAVIATSIDSGDPSQAGTQFTVKIAVTSNDTGKNPIAFGARVGFSTESVSFVSATAGELGSLFVSNSDEGTTPPDVFRDILSTSVFPSPGSTPVCCTVTFEVNASPTTPFTISVGSDPDNATLTDESFMEFGAGEVIFDNTATTDIGATEVLDWSLY